MPGEQTRTLWCLVDLDLDPAPVTVPESANIDYLKETIKQKFRLHVSTSELLLWKLTDPEPIDDTLSRRIKSRGDVTKFAKRLTPAKQVSAFFPQHHIQDHLHILVECLPTTSRKHPRSSSVEADDHEGKREKTYEATAADGHEAKRKQDDTTCRIKGITSQVVRDPSRKWAVDGEIRTIDMNGYYYVDPGIQEESQHCLDAVLRHEFVLLVGAPASGKTTRLLRLEREFWAKGYQVIYLSFKRVTFDNVQAFWNSFGLAVQTSVSLPLSHNITLWSSQKDFLSFFHVNIWERKVILLIDDFSDLYMLHASSDIRKECLEAFREIRNYEAYAIHGVIAAGTSSILYMTPTFTPSPFNVADHVENPYFTIVETRKLFLEFAQDNLITIDDNVIENIWLKSKGHPGMVCLCGRAISENLHTLASDRLLSYKTWITFSATHLHERAYNHVSFQTMIASATPAVNLLRDYFSGFLGTVTLEDARQEQQAGFLTAKGVLSKSAPHEYHMASAFVDELVRIYLI